MSEYRPKKIVPAEALRAELADVIEDLAERVHDGWAAQRISEGWSFGVTRDDARREHPGLVPYSELSEVEKEYDRITALTTLSALAELGYRVSRD
jgi:hypothetical protein